MTQEGARAIFGLFLSFIFIYIIFEVQKSESYQKYIIIDDCVYLETYHVEGYSSSKTKTLVGCDVVTKEKYKNKININF